MKIIILWVLSFVVISLKKVSETRIVRTLWRKMNTLWKLCCVYTASNPDPIYKTITKSEEDILKNCFKLSYIGDLILLRDVIERAYDNEKGRYDFSNLFKYAKEYWKDSDFTIGVFEGPMAGEELGFSSSNYGDHYSLALNFPDEFAVDIKNAGIDLVTVATNHMFDKGKSGLLRTLEVLEENHLLSIGAFKNKNNYKNVQLFEINGIKIVFLAYTYGCNYHNDDFFFSEDNKNLTKLIVRKGSKYYKKCRTIIHDDFVKAKQLNPDLIIVLPHMGEQFLHNPDEFQRHWCDVFVSEGANIILSDHTHAVQPIEWKKNKEGNNVLVVHCPGNYLNSYTQHDGDASMIVNVYIDRISKQPVCSSFVPLYAHCTTELGWYSLPIATVIQDRPLYNSFSIFDQRRLIEVHELVTESAMGYKLSIDNIQKEYKFFAHSGYKRDHVKALNVEDCQYAGSRLLNLIKEANNICFVGDSVTEGTVNGGYGWYEPIAEAFPNKVFSRFAKGAQTSNFFLDHVNEFASLKCDLYVMAFGCNDIRYRNPQICAMTSQDFIENINKIVFCIFQNNPKARIAIIAPWYSTTFDPYCKIKLTEKMLFYKSYMHELELFCEKNGFLYVDANDYIFREIPKNNYVVGGYLKDQIHPSALEGIQLYSKACLLASKKC